MPVSSTMNPRIQVAIQYSPSSRGLRLALAYCRVRRGSEPFFDLYGSCVGYCGGGAYGGCSFHVGEQAGVGFTSFTPTSGGRGWADDRIGVSGLGGQHFTDDAETLLECVEERLWKRWCCWIEGGNPDLRPAAKRRLNCERRQALYVSPGFKWELLEFLSPVWGISLTF